MAEDKLPENDLELETINHQLFEIIYKLRRKYPDEANYSIAKLRAASQDIHQLRIKQAVKETDA